MTESSRQRGFTLIELLTVIAIITLLIGILTPALSSARIQARKAAVRAQINAMNVGLELFNGDEGEYPASNAVLFASDLTSPDGEMNDWEVGDSTEPLQGAHLLLDALAGRDFLGYDPKAKPPGPGGGGGTAYDRWDQANSRRKPYIKIDGVDTSSQSKPPKDQWGELPDQNLVQPLISGSGTEQRLCRVFTDKFGWPILYYRSSSTANQNTPLIRTNPPADLVGNGVYDAYDNEFFTDYTGSEHMIRGPQGNPNSEYFIPVSTDYGESLDDESRFAEFIRSLRATTYKQPPQDTTIEMPRPVNADSFILLSAGHDGIWGNLDDVANFNVLSEER